MANPTSAQLKPLIAEGYNILLMGPAGTGKTSILREAVAGLGLTMKYYSAATLDPFADLVGIPVPIHATETVKYYRPREVDEADVIFMDELNRAENKTLNTVFELILNKSINGEKLPKLKAVVAAINPVTEEYATDELDLALVDRFHFYFNVNAEAPYAYLKAKYGEAYARAAVEVYSDYQISYKASLRSPQNKMGYWSPRRLDILMETFAKFPKLETISGVLPADVSVSKQAMVLSFSKALGTASKKPTTPPVVPKTKKQPFSTEENMKARIDEQLRMTSGNRRSKSNAALFTAVYLWAKVNDADSANRLLTAIATDLNYKVGPNTLDSTWKEVLQDFSPAQNRALTKNWDLSKARELRRLRACW